MVRALSLLELDTKVLGPEGWKKSKNASYKNEDLYTAVENAPTPDDIIFKLSTSF